MGELLTVFPELPLLVLVLIAAMLWRTARRFVIGATVALAAAIVIGVVAHEAIEPSITRCAPTSTEPHIVR